MPLKNSEDDLYERDRAFDAYAHLSKHDQIEETDLGKCGCGSGMDVERALDAQGIYLTKGCRECLPEKLKKYRPEILTGYTQADVDEPIEPEE